MDYVSGLKDKAAQFERKLDNLHINEVSPEPYCRRYLQHLLDHKKYYLAIYADVLNKAIQHSGKRQQELTLVDFGAGNGLLGIFASYCGFKQVFVNDINAHFLEGSRKLASILNVPIAGFILGDIDAVETYCKNEQVDIIVGTDVIEHIYDLSSFFKTLSQINPAIVSVFTTASNPGNPIKLRSLKKLQQKDELIGGNPDDFTLAGEAPHAAFLETRKKIILSQLPGEPIEKIKLLATNSRGLQEKDILVMIKRYVENGTIPEAPAHPTNTCDPATGSWTERILTIPEYQDIYASNGFSVSLYNGFYDEYKTGSKSIVNKTLNLLVKAFGRSLAPFIIFAGYKK